MAIRILIAQEQGVLRSALRALLEKREDLEVTGEVASAEGLLPALRETDPDVLLLDCCLHHHCNDTAFSDALSLRPRLSVVVLGMCENEPCLRRLFDSGVRGYVLKTSPETELLRAIYTSCRGEAYLDSSLAPCGERLRSGTPGASSGAGLGILTEREQEVCRLLAYGHTNAEVAELLAVSGRTVEAHRARIMGKLKLRTRADLVRFALYSGLLRAN